MGIEQLTVYNHMMKRMLIAARDPKPCQMLGTKGLRRTYGNKESESERRRQMEQNTGLAYTDQRIPVKRNLEQSYGIPLIIC